jgi:Ca2+-binding RTX toxin-like protein
MNTARYLGVAAIVTGVLLVGASPASAAYECLGLEVTILGTDGNDTITGTPGDDVIAAGPGNDTVRAGDGIDHICGESGVDKLYGDGDPDTLIGDHAPATSGADDPAGNDELHGGADVDFLIGDSASTWGPATEAGADKLFPEGGGGTAVGDNYTPVTVDSAAPDTITGGSGDDELMGDNYMSGGDPSVFADAAGRDIITGGAGNDEITGDTYSEFFQVTITSARRDSINAGAGGGDIIRGDSFTGGSTYASAADSLNTGPGVAGVQEAVVGDSQVLAFDSQAFSGGDDTITTSAGDDVLIGDNYASAGVARGGGDDRLSAGSGANRLWGDNLQTPGDPTNTFGGGRDTLIAGSGPDELSGGPDRDSCAGAGGIDSADGCETTTGVP